MKPTKHILPAPDIHIWFYVVKKYKIPDMEIYDDRFYTVTLPPGWYMLPRDLEKYPHNSFLYDETCTKVGEIHLNEKERIGFTWLFKDKIIKK